MAWVRLDPGLANLLPQGIFCKLRFLICLPSFMEEYAEYERSSLALHWPLVAGDHGSNPLSF